MTPYGGSTTTTKFAYNGWNSIMPAGTGNANFQQWAILNGDDSLQTRNIDGNMPGQNLARVDESSAPDGGGVYFLLNDYQNSVQAVVDTGGNVKDAVTYNAFGTIESETIATYRGWYAWTGMETDQQTGLQYNNGRWYNAATGTWMTQDPLGFDAGDSNLYRYVNNAPTDARDPSGEISIFFGGAGSEEHGNFKWLRGRITETTFYFKTPAWTDSPELIPVLKQADAEVEKAVKQDKNEKVNIFGYSRGAVFALAFAFKLTKKDNLKVNFLCLIDPITSGLRNVEIQVLWGKDFGSGDRRLGELNKEKVKLPGGIQHTFVAWSDIGASETPVFVPLFGVEKTEEKQVLVEKKYDKVAHQAMNRNEDVIQDAVKAARAAGVPIKGDGAL